MTNKNVFKRRLLKLADLLQKLPRKRFDYGRWVGDDWKGKTDLACGTTACAFGWATTIPALRKAGLRLVESTNGPRLFTVSIKGGSTSEHEAPKLAAREIFGLENDEFEYLFIPDSGITFPELGLPREGPTHQATAKQVAKHIRQFVKAKYNRVKAR